MGDVVKVEFESGQVMLIATPTGYYPDEVVIDKWERWFEGIGLNGAQVELVKKLEAVSPKGYSEAIIKELSIDLSHNPRSSKRRRGPPDDRRGRYTGRK